VIDWPSVKRVLVVRLRSIGDTVLATPSLIALKRFLPHAQVDILLEDWVAPLLDGFDAVDDVITTGKTSAERFRTARELRKRKYDVAFNLHGGTTSTYFVAASRAKHRVGYKGYRYSFFYNHRLSSSSDFWKREKTHSAEQQLALLGFVGVPVEDRPRSQLVVTDAALRSFEGKLCSSQPPFDIHYSSFALLHPAAASATKQWATENFARTAEFLAEKGISTIAVAANHETDVLKDLEEGSNVPIITFSDLTLPEITALASKATIFVGNDSGIAHIAAAVNTPSVVIFGSSNRDHWYPWTDAPKEMVFNEFPCQPCPGYECKEFAEPKCILSIEPEKVFTAIDRVLSSTER
jgi:heptosyltransferase-3